MPFTGISTKTYYSISQTAFFRVPLSYLVDMLKTLVLPNQ